MKARLRLAVALLSGFGPALLALLLTLLVAGYWILPPVGQFVIAAPADRLGLLIYTGTGLFICVIAEFYRRLRDKAAAFDREMVVRESEQSLRVLGDNIPGGAIYQHLLHPDGRVSYLYMSASIEKIFGITAERVTADADAFREFIVEEDRPRCAAAEDKSAREMTPFDCEFRQRTVTGEVKWVHCRSTPRQQENGAILWDGVITEITERKRSEEALRLSAERLGMVLQASSMGTFEIDFTTGEARWNDVEFELLGLLPGAAPACPETFFRFVHPADLETVHAHWEEALRTGSLDVECRVVRADGEERWLAGKGRFVFANKRIGAAPEGRGRAIRFLGVNYDITETKRAETVARELHDAVAQEKDRLWALVNSISDEIWFADLDGRFTLINSSASREFALDADDATDVQTLARRLKVLCPDGSPRPIADAPPLRALRGEVVRNAEELVRTPATGELRYRQVSSTPVKDAVGKVVGAVSVVRDITESKRAEIALRESEQRERERAEELAVLFEAVPIPVFIARDPECLHLAGNRLAGEVLRVPHGDELSLSAHEEIRPCHFRVLKDGRELRLDELPAQRAARGEHIKDFEFVLAFDDGIIRHVLGYGTPLLDDRGRPRGTVAALVDITDQKDAEERIKASLREKEALLKEIHHRVKNNMQVISSLVSLQADALKDPSLRGQFQDVRDRVRSMALVHEKLYQSNSLDRVEFGEYSRSLLHYLWRAHGSVASGIRLSFDLQPVSIPIEMAVPCGLILNELAVNALKHAFQDRSSGEVNVSLRSGPDGCVRLSLRDDGVGLPPGVDWRQSPSLGLRLVQMLAGQLNGTVEIGTGEGTEFVLTFQPVVTKAS